MKYHVLLFEKVAHVFHRRIHWTMLTGIAMNIGMIPVEELQTKPAVKLVTNTLVVLIVSGNVRLVTKPLLQMNQHNHENTRYFEA